jgi:hypothetical protein
MLLLGIALSARVRPPPWWYEEARGITREPPRPSRRSHEELETYLEGLEAELRRVREELARSTDRETESEKSP